MKNLKKIISVTAAAAMVMSTVAPVSVFADDATFKIGGIGPVTGAAAIYGQAVKNATELAINEVNEDGGINGYQVEFKFEDDENDAEKSLNAYNALKDWGMNILVGTVTSTPCVAVANETGATICSSLLHPDLQQSVLLIRTYSVYAFLTRTRVLQQLSTLESINLLQK